MANWRTDAVVWCNDPERGRVVTGSFGFVWWKDKKVFCAPFTEYQKSPVKALKVYTNWDLVRVYKIADITASMLLRFVRSGLLP